MKLKDLFKEKGIFSGKKVLAITMALTFVGGMTLGAAASNHTWGSTGNVVYDNNGTKTTVFNKQDLVYLDDRISTIEASVDTGKVNIAKKLNEWELPADKIVPTTNPSFNQINTALEYIKSIPNAGKEWKDASNNSYYVKEDGSITTNASEAKKNADGNVEPLKISAATAGNLSAGTSAWVDGSLLIGTGADNKNYYNLGYTNGMAKVDNASIIYTYHSHKGTVQGGGECYTPLYRVHTHSGSCYSTVNSTCTCSAYAGQWINDTIFRCRVCGHAGHGPGGTCGAATTSTVLSCGKAEGTRYQSEGLETYVLSCGKTESTIETATIHFN